MPTNIAESASNSSEQTQMNSETGTIASQFLYQHELPSFNPLELTDSKAVTQILSTKGEYWQYEQEWRILTYESNKLFPLPGNITAVTFGLNMRQKDRDAVVSCWATLSDTSKRHVAQGISLWISHQFQFELQHNKPIHRTVFSRR